MQNSNIKGCVKLSLQNNFSILVEKGNLPIGIDEGIDDVALVTAATDAVACVTDPLDEVATWVDMLMAAEMIGLF